MSRLCLTLIIPVLGLALAPQAAAQYYTPKAVPASNNLIPGGVGFDHGLRHSGFNPSVGAGLGPIGAGVGTGFGRRGIGAGVNAGVGPIGATTNAGLSRKGIGARGSAGVGNTGAAFEGGLSRGGVGVGANARVLGVGGGVSAGLGKRGPGLGASLAFGNVGTLLIGSHKNSYPGARQTSFHTRRAPNAAYYAQQNYGTAPYYVAPVQRYKKAKAVKPAPIAKPLSQSTSVCGATWTC